MCKDCVEPEEVEEAVVEPELTHCGICDGPLMYLGALGRVEHYRCQHCGADHRSEV
jgi:tRNA(Ile2) C34 agmatinyltransferase TiaS